jgi:hypothetical protein
MALADDRSHSAVLYERGQPRRPRCPSHRARHLFEFDAVAPYLEHPVMPPRGTALTPPRDMVHCILPRRRLKLVSVHRLKSVPPRMIRRDPFILDLELVSHPLRYSAAGRVAASAISIRFEHREQRPLAELAANAVNIIQETLGEQIRVQRDDSM